MLKVECIYSKQEELDKDLNTIRERIQALEQNLIIPFKYSWERKREYPEYVEIQLSEKLQEELFEKNHDNLLDLRFKKFPNALTILPEAYYRESCKRYWPLRFIMYASGSNFLTGDLLPEGLSSRLELANIYLQKAQSFNFARNYDHLTVLTLNSIASVLFHLDEKDASIVYVKLAVLMAKKIGMNTEKGVGKMSHFDYERENIRRIWWLIFSNFSLTPVSFGIDTMVDADNEIFLPSDNFYFEPGTPNDYYGIEIMSSAEWYTCTLKHQSLQGYRMLLHRIQLKIHRYNQLELSENRNDLAYIAGAISSSLEEWKITLSPIIDSFLIKLRFNIKVDVEKGWLAAYLGLVYNSCRINLVLANFMKNIIKGKNVEQQLYFVEALVAGKENSEILSLLIQNNPKLEHISSVSIFPIFICGFFLLCCRKISSLCRPEVEAYYYLHLKALELFSIAFQKINRFYQILLSMEKMSLLDTIIYFGTFKRRHMDEALEKQTPNHIDKLKNLSIKSGDVIGFNHAPYALLEGNELQEKQLELMEDRIKTLEQNLITPLKYYWQVKKHQVEGPSIPEVYLSKELEQFLFENDHDYLLNLRFQKFPSATTIVSEQYYRESAKLYWPLRFVLYSSGSNFVTNDMLPRGIVNRLELVSIYLQKAQSFKFAKDYDHLTVLTLSTIGSVLFHSDKKESMLIYTKMAIEMAKILKINTEEGIARITPFDYEREHIRRIWWLLYANFAQIPNSFGVDTISNSEQKIFLPSDNPYFESATANDYFGIEIMSDLEWYTPLIHDQSIQGYRILLHRIQLQIHRYNQIELVEDLKEASFIAGSINASLKDWFLVFQPKLALHLFNLKNSVSENLEEAWLAVYLGIVYSSNRVNLVLASFMKNVIKGKKVAHQLYFKEAVEAVLMHGRILQIIIEINPSFQQISTFTLLPCAFFLLCCRKIPQVYSSEIERAYQLHLEGFKLFSLAFQKKSRLYNILQSMEAMPIVDAIIYFGMFKRRNMDETVEIQSINHINLMSKHYVRL